MDRIRERLTEHMLMLCKECGSKHCGSVELERAGQYIENIFREQTENVRREEFQVPGWLFYGFDLIDLTTNKKVPTATACYYSNRVDITDVPVWLETGDIEHIDEHSVENRLCFVASWGMGPSTRYYNHVAEVLENHGASAAIFLSYGQTDLAPNTKIERNPFLKKLGTAAVAQEGALYIAANRTHTYRLTVDAECMPVKTSNVIARIGNGPRLAVIGAHYDTAPLIEGAADNAGGTSVLLELVRLLKNSVPDEWTIDFTAFSAEEIVPYDLPLGSKDYVERHKDEAIEWLLNIDGPAAYFDIPNVSVGLEEKLPPIDYPYEVVKTSYIGDDKSFGQAGIPSVWIFKRRIFGERHTAEDRLECIDFDLMTKITKDYVSLFKQLTEGKVTTV